MMKLEVEEVEISLCIRVLSPGFRWKLAAGSEACLLRCCGVAMLRSCCGLVAGFLSVFVNKDGGCSDVAELEGVCPDFL